MMLSDTSRSAGCMRRIDSVYIAWNAVIVGDVTIGEDTNIWPFVCARGDVAAIRIGRRCSIQDQAMLHCQNRVPLIIGDDVIVGHQACVHCQSVGDRTLIGIGARVLDQCEIGCDCLIAAGAVLRPGTVVPDGSMVAGVPGKIIRPVTDADRQYHGDVISRYIELAKAHCDGRFSPIPSPKSGAVV